MNKKTREQVRLKYNGLCAYTGKPLGDDWQVDHMTSVYKHIYKGIESDVNNIKNLMPALRIVNHYKRSLDLEGFRDYMSDFHKRLGKLPKKTSVERTANRIIYMNKVADAFDITVDKPFDGLFFFEKQV